MAWQLVEDFFFVASLSLKDVFQMPEDHVDRGQDTAQIQSGENIAALLGKTHIKKVFF